MARGRAELAGGGANQARVFDIVRRAPDGVSRIEIAAQTDVSAQTVSTITRRLIDAGLVREGDRVAAGPGKPRTRLHLVPDARYAVGIHLDPARITYSLVDLLGRVIARHATATPSGQAPDAVEESMIASTDALLESCGADRQRLIGIGVAAPGPVDVDRGIVNRPPLLPGWDNVPLSDVLAERFGLPVLLEKDVTSATVGELWAGTQDVDDDVAVLYLGAGVGLGVALDRTALRGATSNFGDIGHLKVAADGPPCSCGQRGCLGVRISPAHLLGLAPGQDPVPGDHAGIAAAFAALCERAPGDPAIGALLDGAADDIAEAVTFVINMFDVTMVVMSGPLWAPLNTHALARIRDRVQRSAALVVPHPVTIGDSVLGPDAAAVGAGCQVLERAFSGASPSPFATRALAP
ncbi:ROK family transcriptional regulator [Microbacterium stercoris]|uniref:ROK family transcriptional regulator n=1 Tax=Microbacterium stercoris TaxID=2820289 RepID=A0A939QI77_9MICO|nr:ROK family transcriptional regulator [Microbacterium stercoris]MBO3662540.1 ROK family transcriptional regulator [Microbacterium stercoris]